VRWHSPSVRWDGQGSRFETDDGQRGDDEHAGSKSHNTSSFDHNELRSQSVKPRICVGGGGECCQGGAKTAEFAWRLKAGGGWGGAHSGVRTPFYARLCSFERQIDRILRREDE
jgi:hypothetical protein